MYLQYIYSHEIRHNNYKRIIFIVPRNKKNIISCREVYRIDIFLHEIM